MAGRPKAKQLATEEGCIEPTIVDAGRDAYGEEPDVDLDARERAQSAERKAPGPGRPHRAAAESVATRPLGPRRAERSHADSTPPVDSE